MDFRQLLLIGTGGFLGSTLRFLASGFFATSIVMPEFPIGTLLVNAIGCLLIGVITAILELAQPSSQDLRLFLITGMLGGFTTFSAFGMETITLLRRDLYLSAALYVFLSVIMGVLAVWIGLRSVELICRR
jgi:CrcB protein